MWRGRRARRTISAMTRPSPYDPRKAVPVIEPPSGPRWVHELKLDGYRMGVFATRRGKSRGVRITSRNGNDFTAAYPEIARSGLALVAELGLQPPRPSLLRVRPARGQRREPDGDGARGPEAPVRNAHRRGGPGDPLRAAPQRRGRRRLAR